MAQVPKSDGHRGGISTFVLDYRSEGVTVEHRNAFMGLRGIENSVTRLEDVFVPNENLIGREGQGLKIALSTLNTGRLALPVPGTASTGRGYYLCRRRALGAHPAVERFSDWVRAQAAVSEPASPAAHRARG